MERFILVAIIGAAYLSLFTGTSGAQTTYYLSKDQPAGDSWSTLNDWWSIPGGTGTHPTTLNGNDFDSAGFLVRSPLNASNVFGNAATQLTMEGGTIGIKATANGSITIATLITSTPLTAETNAIGNASSATETVNVTNFTNAAPMTLNTDASSNSLVLVATNMTGSGNLILDSGKTTAGTASVGLNLTNATGYTGNITFNSTDLVELVLMNNLTSGGGLIIPSNETVSLGGFNGTFSGLTISGTTYAPGVYSYSELDASYPSIFSPTQSSAGEITVTPEPGPVGGLLLSGGLMVLYRRRAIA